MFDIKFYHVCVQRFSDYLLFDTINTEWTKIDFPKQLFATETIKKLNVLQVGF